MTTSTEIFRAEDHADLIGQRYTDEDGTEWTMIGIMYDVDDWWWVMSNQLGVWYYSCVMAIEGYGFDRIE